MEVLIKTSFPRKWACTREGESSALIILDSRLRGSDENDLISASYMMQNIQNTTSTWRIPYLGALLAFFLLFVLGNAYWQAFQKNILFDHQQALNSRLDHQTSIINQSLCWGRAPLHALGALVETQRGDIDDFESFAANLLRNNPVVEAVELAPDGILQKYYSPSGFEAALGHNLLEDPNQLVEVQESIKTNSMILAGPVLMAQGGMGFFLRQPIFWEENGETRFWGLAIAKLSWENLEQSFLFQQLEEQGYVYRLSRQLSTDSEPVVFSQSTEKLIEQFSVHKTIPIPGGHWQLDLSFDHEHVHPELPKFFVFGLAIMGATVVFLVLQNKERHKLQAMTLTKTNTRLEEEIARRTETETHLRQAKETAEAAVQTKSDFLAFMTHEIRTPMNGVFGMLQLLNLTSLNTEQKGYVDTGIIALNSLISMINDLLDISKMEAGKMELDIADFDVNQLFHSIPNLFRAQTERKNIAMHLDIDTAVPRVLRGDTGRIRQVVLNLVSNAVKFTDQGEIAIHIAGLEKGQNDDAVWMQIIVRDTGPGIPADQVAVLFKPYSQTKSTTRQNRQGTGLGLSIVKQLIELMGGTVSLDSTVGIGTTVRVTLPLHKAQGQPLPTNTEQFMPLPGANAGLTVLVAEDDPIAQEMLASILRKLGHHPICVDNGLEAINKWREVGPDLVLLDNMMPIVDGWETARRIRDEEQQTGRNRVPIVAVTAVLMDEMQEDLRNLGLDDCISKPIHIQDLKKIIDRLVPKRPA